MPIESFFKVTLTKKGVCHQNYHKSFLGELKKENVMRSIDTPESRAYFNDLTEDEGNEVIKGIIRTITHLKGFSLYSYQLDFVKVILPTLFKKIYRKTWKRNRRKIMRYHGMTKIYDEVFFISPRRMGKTITLGFCVLAILVNMQKMVGRPFKIAVFATTQDASIRFIQECALGWKRLDIKDKFEFSKNATCITIVKKDDPFDIREIKAFASGQVSPFFFR